MKTEQGQLDLLSGPHAEIPPLNLEQVVAEVFNRHHQKTTKDDPVYMIATVLELAARHYGRHATAWLAVELNKQRVMTDEQLAQSTSTAERLVQEGTAYMVSQVGDAAKSILVTLPKDVASAVKASAAAEFTGQLKEMRRIRAGTLIGGGLILGACLASLIYAVLT